jgi:hypothetical protein
MRTKLPLKLLQKLRNRPRDIRRGLIKKKTLVSAKFNEKHVVKRRL